MEPRSCMHSLTGHRVTSAEVILDVTEGWWGGRGCMFVSSDMTFKRIMLNVCQ